MDEAPRLRTDITYCENVMALLDIDALIVVTLGRSSVRFRRFAGPPSPPVFVDARRAFERGSVERYEGIGL